MGVTAVESGAYPAMKKGNGVGRKYTLQTRTAKVEESIIELFEKGLSRNEIARQLEVSTPTIRKVLTNALQSSRLKRARSRLVLALDVAAESVVSKLPVDAELSFRVLDRMGVFPSEIKGNQTIDNNLNIAVGLLTSTPMSHGNSGNTSTTLRLGPGTPDPSAHEGPPACACVPLQEQFFKVLDNNRSVINNLQANVGAERGEQLDAGADIVDAEILPED